MSFILKTIPYASIEEKISLFETVRRSHLRKKQILFMVGFIIFAVLLFGSSVIGRVNGKAIRELYKVWNYIEETIPVLRAEYLIYDLSTWYARGHIWLERIFDTILIAFLATFFSVVGAFILCFPASRNLMRNYPVYFICRRILDIARAVPELVYAMIFVFAFDLGALPGVLAIAVHSTGSLGKLFSEVNENIDLESIEGIRSAGGNWFQVIRFAVVPQVLPNFTSYALLRLELNIRAATVIGLVGAGGIGMELMFAIRQFQYTEISAITLMIIAIVVLLDLGCEKLRHHLIREGELI